MKKWLSYLAILLVSAYISVAHAEKTVNNSDWIKTDDWAGSSTWIDVNAIRPVILPGGSAPLPNIYTFSTKVGSDFEKPLYSIRSFGDLQSGNVLFYTNGKDEDGWHSEKNGISALVD